MQDTFVDQNDITLLLEPGAKPDLEAISALLEKEKIVVEKATTREEQGF